MLNRSSFPDLAGDLGYATIKISIGNWHTFCQGDIVKTKLILIAGIILSLAHGRRLAA